VAACIWTSLYNADKAIRRRHIKGRIVEVPCAWSNGSTGTGTNG